MLVPLSWLREYVDIDLTPEALAEQLTLRGMEVSGIEVSGADWTDVIVGRLLDVQRHPNADTLWLTSVDVGEGEALSIVCGAQNLEVGQLVPVARVGAVLPGERRIERSKIRGVVSHGMLCSAAELGLGSDADGIHILGTDAEHPLGTDLRQLFGEVVLDVDVKPNRGDALSMVGLAREIAAFTGGALRMPAVEVVEATTSVILESAVFHGPTIRNTARRLGLRSEASARHEKGFGWDLPRLAADRAAQLISEITGATVAAGIVDNDPEPKLWRRIEVDLGRASRLVGVTFESATARKLLTPLGFRVEGSTDAISVAVPPHRLDVVEAVDVAEELARAHGYAAIPARLPIAELPPYRPDPSAERHTVRRILAGLGLDEVVTHALIGPSVLRRSGYDPDAEGLVRLFNPLSEEHSILRPVPYPSLLAALDENVRQRRESAWLFEIGKTYRDIGERPVPEGAESAGTGRIEAWHVGIALTGPPVERAGPARAADIGDLKGIVEVLHEALGIEAPGYRPESGDERHPHLHPGRAARLVDRSGRAYGSIGEVHPEIVAAWNLSGRPVIAAIHLPQLFALRPSQPRVRPVPAAQPIDRDLAVVVSDATPLGDVLRIARTSAGATLSSLRVFDVYRGAQIGEGASRTPSPSASSRNAAGTNRASTGH